MDIMDLEECDFVQFDPRGEEEKYVSLSVPRDRRWMAEQRTKIDDHFKRVEHFRDHPPPRTISIVSDDDEAEEEKEEENPFASFSFKPLVKD